MTSGDWHPIHADAEFAGQSIAGQRIFQGSYGLHVAMAMATMSTVWRVSVTGRAAIS